jgi:GT2 family glycosyltransferase
MNELAGPSGESEADGSLRIAIGIATIGRPSILRQTLTELRRQIRPADAIFVCAPSAEDIAGLAATFPAVHCLIGPRGLSLQRNELLRHLAGFDVVIFLDDDFVPCPGYVAAIEQAFAASPEVAMTTGAVIADGICGQELTFAAARDILAAAASPDGKSRQVEDAYSAYGCNMAVRLAVLRAHGVAFDENLPLYAWLEDVDFSRRVARHGRIVKVPSARGIHLGVKSGRQSGVRLGYSQIANPMYLMRKGTYERRRAFSLMARNLIANIVKSLWPEPYIDRVGRTMGNARALIDFVTGRLAPSRILSL